MRYFAPTTVEEAVGLLAEAPGRKVFAGASDLIPQIRSGRPEPDGIVDLKRIARLVQVRSTGTGWVIGAATPTVMLTSHETLATEFPGLVEAAGLIGSDQVQSRSSLGGNLCNASPAADSVPAMVVNDMRAVIATVTGTRTIPVHELPAGPGRTTLAPGEFVIEFELDHAPPGTADAYLRLIPRTEMDIAVVGAGARVTLDAEGRCTSATIALGAVAPTVVLLPDAAAALAGRAIDDGSLPAVAAAASAACNPIDDKRGTIAYRRHVAGVLAKRAVTTAAERARARTNGRTTGGHR
ncbi:MAG: xanthine dehydrogenase family protein subunit M [Acidimicrobiia bacterium]|nr:xanthine dehydrogenase family protein subunit M [Acidimicrobiia bacterium]